VILGQKAARESGFVTEMAARPSKLEDVRPTHSEEVSESPKRIEVANFQTA
jgi:hypothetical protein